MRRMEPSRNEKRMMEQSARSKMVLSMNARNRMVLLEPCSTEQPGFPDGHDQDRFQSRAKNVLQMMGHRRLEMVVRTNVMVIHKMTMEHRTRLMAPIRHAMSVHRRKMIRNGCSHVPEVLPSLCAADDGLHGGLPKIDVLG